VEGKTAFSQAFSNKLGVAGEITADLQEFQSTERWRGQFTLLGLHNRSP
jgi:hypothetical protein